MKKNLTIGGSNTDAGARIRALVEALKANNVSVKDLPSLEGLDGATITVRVKSGRLEWSSVDFKQDMACW